jgi:ubiquinone/menaquinone biosynthesis C-methylase UbiE
MKKNVAKKRYDRIAWIYDFMELPVETMSFSLWRDELLSAVTGSVLEVGIGTGKNLPFYRADIDLHGIDISPEMFKRAKRRADNMGMKADLRVMDVEKMTFPDQYFDFAVSTFVFCSVPDPVKGMQEVKRVLKPGGTVLFLEHVRSENRILGTIMDFLNPLIRSIVGANINRRTVENITKAGLEIISVENKGSHIVKKISARPLYR